MLQHGSCTWKPKASHGQRDRSGGRASEIGSNGSRGPGCYVPGEIVNDARYCAFIDGPHCLACGETVRIVARRQGYCLI